MTREEALKIVLTFTICAGDLPCTLCPYNTRDCERGATVFNDGELVEAVRILSDNTEQETPPMIQKNWREYTLDEARRAVCTDRNKQYGEPEKSFEAIADLWSAYLAQRGEFGVMPPLSPTDAATMLILFKVARGVTAKTPKPDTFADIAGYAACACECAMKDDGSEIVFVPEIETRKGE